MTQLEITTSTWSSGSGMSSMWPLRNWAFSAPASAVLLSQLQHLVGHVQAVGLAAQEDPPGREQHIYAATAAQVQDHLTRQRGKEP